MSQLDLKRKLDYLDNLLSETTEDWLKRQEQETESFLAGQALKTEEYLKEQTEKTEKFRAEQEKRLEEEREKARLDTTSEDFIKAQQKETEDYLEQQRLKSETFLEEQEKRLTEAREKDKSDTSEDFIKAQEKKTQDYLEQQQLKQQQYELERTFIDPEEEERQIKAAIEKGASIQEAVAQTFKDLEKPIGEGQWKIKAMKMYRPPRAMEIPGTSFSDVCPGQAHVNRQIVEAKLEAGLPGCPVIPAMVTQQGKITLADKHHTFVACMALGKPVKLALTGVVTTPTPGENWQACTWKGFEKPGNATRGFGLSKEESAFLEGSKEPSPQWRRTVPWRKDVPSSDKGKVKEMMTSFEKGTAKGKVTKDIDPVAVSREFEKACQDDPGLGTKLYEVLKMGLVKVVVRPTPEKTTGGDWDPDENTIYVDDNLSPVDMVDMLVWEGHNAIHQLDFSKVLHEGYAERRGPDQIGEAMAKIEVKTEVDYLEHLIARREKGGEISKNGAKHIEKIDEAVPGYSTMTKEQRQQALGQVEKYFLSTPHGGPTAVLPDREALSSGELYAYQHLGDRQNAKGVAAYFRDKLPEKHQKRSPFLIAINKVPDCDLKKPPMSWAPKFYSIVAEMAQAIFGVTVPPLTPAQKTVADHEYTARGGSWETSLRSELQGILDAPLVEEVPEKEIEVSPEQKQFQDLYKKLGDALQNPAIKKDDEGFGEGLNTLFEQANELANLDLTDTVRQLTEAVSAYEEWDRKEKEALAEVTKRAFQDCYTPPAKVAEEIATSLKELAESTGELKPALERLDGEVSKAVAQFNLELSKVKQAGKFKGALLGLATAFEREAGIAEPKLASTPYAELVKPLKEIAQAARNIAKDY